MQIAAGIEDRPQSKLAKRIATEDFECPTRVVFFDIKGSTSIIPNTHSTYNPDFIPYGLAALVKVLALFDGSHVATIAPYTAQVATYRHAKQRLGGFYLRRPNSATLVIR